MYFLECYSNILRLLRGQNLPGTVKVSRREIVDTTSRRDHGVPATHERQASNSMTTTISERSQVRFVNAASGSSMSSVIEIHDHASSCRLFSSEKPERWTMMIEGGSGVSHFHA